MNPEPARIEGQVHVRIPNSPWTLILNDGTPFEVVVAMVSALTAPWNRPDPNPFPHVRLWKGAKRRDNRG